MGGSPYAYAELLARLWAEGDGFVVVEHDIEIHGDVLPGFAACGEPWCVFPYPGPGDHAGNRLLDHALGCTRFGASLLKAEPGVPPGPGSHWGSLDARLYHVLVGRGYRPHVHLPPVVHHHERDGRCDCGQRAHREEPT